MKNIKVKTFYLIILVSIAIIFLLVYLLTRPQPQPIVVSAGDSPFVGPADAKVTVIEFFDFQCPVCRDVAPTFKQIIEKYKDRVKFVARDFPLSYHSFAQKASEAARCAHEQGKYWEYHDLIIEGNLDVDSLKQYAKDLGLNTTQFNDCLDSGKYSSEIQKDYNDGVSYRIAGTPTFFVNGKEIPVRTYADFERLIESALNA